MNKLLLAAVLAFAPAVACAQGDAPVPAPAPAPVAVASPPAPAAAALPDADPALWVVRDADTTIYLFGTFHLLDGRPWFNDEVKTAFDASDELVMEAILPEDPCRCSPMIMRYAVDHTGRTLSGRLTAAENAALARALTPLGLPAAAFDRFEPWFASMMLSVTAAQRLGLDAANGPRRCSPAPPPRDACRSASSKGSNGRSACSTTCPRRCSWPPCAPRCAR